MGVTGIEVPISPRETVKAAWSRFADDFAAFILVMFLHALFDAIDIFCCASANDSNRDKTLGFYIGRRRTEAIAWEKSARSRRCTFSLLLDLYCSIYLCNRKHVATNTGHPCIMRLQCLHALWAAGGSARLLVRISGSSVPLPPVDPGRSVLGLPRLGIAVGCSMKS